MTKCYECLHNYRTKECSHEVKECTKEEKQALPYLYMATRGGLVKDMKVEYIRSEEE